MPNGSVRHLVTTNSERIRWANLLPLGYRRRLVYCLRVILMFALGELLGFVFGPTDRFCGAVGEAHGY